MKDLRGAIRSILLADPIVSAAVGGSRIYPGTIPQGVTAPSIVQNLISEDLHYHMQGDSNLMFARTQLVAWAKTQDDAVYLAGVVFDRLSGFSSPSWAYGTSSPQERIEIQGVFHDQGSAQYDPDGLWHGYRRDYLFWYRVR